MEVSCPPRALVQVPPVAGELTSSWSRRLALGYGMPVQDLVRGVISRPEGTRITGAARSGRELYLNGPARAAFARFSGIPLNELAARLPGFAFSHERLEEDAVARAAWWAPRKAWVAACPPCSGRSWSRHQPVLVYPEAAGHVCQRHHRWLLANCQQASAIDLRPLPEVLLAHRRHAALVRSHPEARAVMKLAAAAVWSWQVQGWQQKAGWHSPTSLLASLTGCAPSAVAAHTLIAYPDTVTVARLLADQSWQARLRETATASGTPAATQVLLEEVGRRTRRLWLGDWMAACSRAGSRPGVGAGNVLEQWVARLSGADGAGHRAGEGLWAVPRPARRPVGYGERTSYLIESSSREANEEAGRAFLTGGWEPT
ncbi:MULTISPECIES: TniQ family protein [Streptomyces]|uniref:TniQ family protein n=1 Tax=Streptomyces TaxID=1883 RepID=UPI0005A8A507|nr:TniQ family protein [Streptomyces griseus]